MIDAARLIRAASDYRFLLDRGYPGKPSLKLIADHHRLTRIERNVLFRGVFASATSGQRRARLCRPEQAASLAVDGHNVLFTVANYLAGHSLFVATDGLLRDAGGAKSVFRNRELLGRAAREIAFALSAAGTAEIAVYLDEPLTHSADHRALLERALAEHDVSGRCLLSVHADSAVVEAAAEVTATSDSTIIDRLTGSVWDLSRAALEAAHQPSFFDIEHALE